MKNPLVSVVILNWNGLKDTLRCIESVKALDYSNFEIIVVDNGSKDDQKLPLRDVGGIILVENPINRGFTGGHIDGYKHAKGDYILLLNNDAIVKNDLLNVALNRFRTDATIAAVGGRAYHWDEEFPPLNESNPYYSFQEIDHLTGEARSLQHDNGIAQTVNNVSGSAVLVDRKVIEDVGYLHEPFFAYFEETDLFARMKRRGYKIVYDPAMRIWHKNGASSGSESHFFYYQIFLNRFIFALRNFEARRLPYFLYNYYKIGLKNSLKLLVREKRLDTAMPKAYALASLRALIVTPKLLIERKLLANKLGRSDYNTLLFTEQSCISVVVDCMDSSKKQLAALYKKLSSRHVANIEYILITSHSNSPQQLLNGVRCVINKGYFDTHPYNLGCVVAKFNRIIICNKDSIPETNKIGAVSKEAYLSGKRVISLDRCISFDKSFFKEIGSIPGRPEHPSDATEHILEYAYLSRDLSQYLSVRNIGRSNISKTVRKQILAKRKFNLSLNKSRLQLRGEQFLARHYRILQSTSLIRWVLMPTIPIRIKLGRIRNSIIHALTLNRTLLALDIKHSRNELIIYGRRGIYQLQNTFLEKHRPSSMNKKDMAIFIICYERVDSLSALVSWLELSGFKKIVFIDNDSSYPPLLEFYEKSPYQVLRLHRNVGHTSPWSLNIIRSLVPNNFYIVSDPDVVPTESCPSDTLEHLLTLHFKHASYQKIGLGLKIDDLPSHYPLKESVIKWEKQFWANPIDDEVFEAGVDTTFALYKPYVYDYILHPSLRTNTPYLARHTPWYINPAEQTKEDLYYKLKAQSGVTSWNVDELPERYKKELAKILK